MRSGDNETGRRLWWRWTAGCVGGWFLGFLAGFAAAASLEGTVASSPVMEVLGYAGLGFFVGAGVGFMQWRLLRQHLAGVASWIAASAIGLGIAGGVGYGVAVPILGFTEDIANIPAVLGWTIVAGFGGVIAGLLQRRVLARHGVDWHGWVLASTLGWALSFAAFGTVAVVSDRLVAPGVDGLGFFVAMIAGGLVLGVVTAAAAGHLLGKGQGSSFDKPAHV